MKPKMTPDSSTGRFYLSCPNCKEPINFSLIRSPLMTYANKPDHCAKCNAKFDWDDVAVITLSLKPEIPLDTPIDTPLLAWDNGDRSKSHVHFAGFDDEGNILAFVMGHTSWTTALTARWDHAELAKPDHVEAFKKKDFKRL